jgi:hypothetical protein
MRIAAGIILLVLVVFGLVALIIDVKVLNGLDIPSSTLVSNLFGLVYTRIVSGGFLVAAGVLCLKRKYWGLCLAPALFALLTGISSVVEPLLRGHFSTSWQTWIWVIGALISTIFISLTKKEWQENQSLPDSSRSKGRGEMRIAAGILLIILAVSGLAALIISVRTLIGLGIPSLISVSNLFRPVYNLIIWDGFLVAGGVFCLKRKYWGLCLAPALFALLGQISVVVEPLLRGHFVMSWQTWIWVIGALISTIFISLTKKEWQKPQALLDSSTS